MPYIKLTRMFLSYHNENLTLLYANINNNLVILSHYNCQHQQQLSHSSHIITANINNNLVILSHYNCQHQQQLSHSITL